MKKQSFKLSPWHFLLAIVIFFILTGFIAEKIVKDIPISEKGNSILTELHEIDLDKEDITFLFFYRKDSELCRKMRYNIKQLDANNLHGINFYAMDIEESTDYISPQINRAVKNKSYFYNCYGKEEKFYIENQG